MQNKNARIVLLTGGNLGDRWAHIRKAEVLINQHIGDVIKRSSVYESAPWGFESETHFLNQVLIIETQLSPVEVLRKCQEIEDQFGRVRNPDHYISRTMDVDVLFYDEEVIATPELSVPHPLMHKRRFTMQALDEVMSTFVHPVLKKSVKDLLEACEDPSEVSIFEAS